MWGSLSATVNGTILQDKYQQGLSEGHNNTENNPNNRQTRLHGIKRFLYNQRNTQQLSTQPSEQDIIYTNFIYPEGYQY